MESHAKNNEFEERRGYTRFPVEEWGTVATLGPKQFVVGRVLDISKSGLSFQYIPNGVHIKDPTEVNICVFGHVFLIQSFPCRRVYDVDEAAPDFSVVLTKRCGIEFRGLADEQVTNLEFFLKTYIRGGSG